MNRTTRLFMMVVIAILVSFRSALALPNPVGWWNFDEGSGTLTADSSGNGNTGTVGGSWITNGMSSNAVTYTTSQYTSIPYWSGFNLSNSISLSIWIKPSGPGSPGPGFSQFFTKGDGYFGNWGLRFTESSNILFQMTGMNGNSISSISLVPSNLWTHVVATFDGTTAKLYINGLLDRFATWSGSQIFTTNGIQIGVLPGAIDDARVYSNALTEIQVAQLFLEQDRDLDRLIDANETICGTDPNNPDSDGDGYPDGMEVWARTNPLDSSSHPDVTTGLVGWWKFDEGSGTLTADSTTNGDFGTVTSGSTWVTGIHSNALQFDGVNGYVVTSDPGGSGSPLAVTNLTIAFWANVTNTVQDSTVLDRYDNSGYAVWWQEGYDRVILVLPNIQPIPIFLDDVSSNVWNHFAFTCDGSNVNCYLNGRLYSSGSYTNAVGTSPYPLYLAQAVWFGNRFQGILDDVRIYNRALAAGDVYALGLVGTYCNGLPDIQKFRLGLNPNTACTTGDGIPDDWAVAHGLDPLDSTVATQTCTLAFTHGLNNLQVYQNQSVLISDGYSTLGDGVADWWKVTYGFSLTDTNVASADPEGDGLSNLQKYQLGLNPFVSYAITAPSIVLINSTSNTASVADAGAGASYSWSIDNGTIDGGSGTPNISWSAGDSGVATLTMQLTTSGGSANLSAPITVTPCSLAANITVPSSVLLGSTNTASLPNPLTVLYSFTNGVDGAIPVGVVQGTGIYSNALYGAAAYGGTNGAGTLFSITPDGATLSTLWQFDPNTDGDGPSTLVQGSSAPGTTNRYFYGVTTGGGPGSNGTVFAITPGGSLTNLHAFNYTQGSYPAGLTQGRDGNFYGVTEAGGSNNNGVVFMISSNINTVTFKILYYFNGGTNGNFSQATLMQGSGTDTSFYGTTHFGGTNSACLGGCGTIFKITTNGVFSYLHVFNGSDGGWPTTPLTLGTNGLFYGTGFTGGSNGCGIAFSISSQGTFNKLYTFGDPNGRGPDSGLLQGFDGNFYGTTVSGGLTNIFNGVAGYGTAFKLTPQGTNTVLHQFSGSPDGYLPFEGGLTTGFAQGKTNGYLYGVTLLGGTSTNCWAGCGTVFLVNPSSYIWSVAGGTILTGQGTPTITWTADSPGGAIISVIISNSPVCTTNVSVTVPITAYNEWYGPFNSWTNVSAWGADGGGTNDDTGSINTALAAIGLNGCSPVLYCPGKYLISHTLNLSNCYGVAVVGKDAAVSGFKWIGNTGTQVGDATTMFRMNANDTCYIERLTFDGQGKAFTLVNHSQWTNSPPLPLFDNGNTWSDCVFKNAAAGGMGIAGGWYGWGFSNETFLRCVLSNLTVGCASRNFNALDGWFVNCMIENCGIGLQMRNDGPFGGGGQLHAYQTAFVNNGTDVCNNTANNFTSETGNTSWHAYTFYAAADTGGNNSPTLLKGNTIIDPTGQPFTFGTQGPFVVMDNVVAYTNGAAINFTKDGTTVLMLGNTNCSSPFYSIGSSPSTNLVDNVTVSRSSLTFTQPGIPVEATNLNRTIVDMPRNMTSASLQTAINGAADGTVIHITFTNPPPIYYSMNATVTIPTNRDIRIIGDGPQSKFGWDGSSPLPMFSLSHPSHATFSRLFLAGNSTPQHSASLIRVSGVGSTLARVYIRDCVSTASTNANLDLGDCPNTTIDWRGNHEVSGGGAGLLLEGGGTVKFITTDSGESGIDAVVTNGGTLYVETSYNESDPSNFKGYRSLLLSGGSTAMYLCGIQHENGGCTGPSCGDGFYSGGTSNGFGVTNFSGIFTMSLVGGISDWVRISGTQSGNVWLEGDTTFRSPTRGGDFPIINTNVFLPVQSQNWDYIPNFANYSDVGNASPSYTRTMFGPSRSTYSDLGPMTRRTNQTDVLIEDTVLALSLENIQVAP